MTENPKGHQIKDEDFILECDPSIKDDFKEFCIVIKQVRKDEKYWSKATKIKQEILDALELKREIEDIKANMKTSEYLYSGEFSKHIMDRITKIFGDKMIQ